MRLIVLIFLIFLGGCNGVNYEQLQNHKLDELYDMAQQKLRDDDLTTALKLLNAIEAYYPYDYKAQNAKLAIAYCYYKMNESELAASEIEQFIDLYPGSKYIDYAMFLKAKNSYADVMTMAYKNFPIDRGLRERSQIEASYEIYNEFLTKYPKSEYAAKAKHDVNILVDLLSTNALNKTEYYAKRKAWFAVANNSKEFLEKYPLNKKSLVAKDLLETAEAKIKTIFDNDKQKR
jgi:outer membrane protein assembly factor BamD